MTEVGVGCPGGDDQKVVFECLLLRDEFLLFQVKTDYFFKQHFNVGVASQYRADGRRYFAGREAGGSDLVEQRLEGVVVFSVNDCDLNGEMSDPSGGGQASETGAHDYHSRSGFGGHWILFIGSTIEIHKNECSVENFCSLGVRRRVE